jgi:hypothetical protein
VFKLQAGKNKGVRSDNSDVMTAHVFVDFVHRNVLLNGVNSIYL